jgi:hypothetical protein
VQLPPPNAPDAQPAPQKGSKMPLIAGAAVILVAGVVAFFVFHHSGSAEPSPNAPAPVAAQGASPSPAASGPTAGNPAASAAADWAKPMMGTWVADGANAMTGTSQDPSPDRKAKELARLEVSGQGDQISIHAWGGCHTCDWGSQTAVVEGGNKVTAAWDFAKLTTSGEPDSGRVAHVTINPDGDKLSVLVQNTYSNRGPSKRQSQFGRLP